MSRRRKPAPAPRLAFGELRAEGGGLLAAGLGGSPEERAAWLQLSARYGLVEAQTLLGQCLLDGSGILSDSAAAAHWFTIAAEAAHPPAMNMLGRCLERGWGVAVDVAAAAHWYGRAAEAGLDWAQYNLANALLRGRGIARDREAAFAWFLRAAAQGHAKSMNLVGRFLEEGWDRPADRVRAAAWYRQAAEGGDYRGAYNWAACLAARGAHADAAHWFVRAAIDGTPDLLDIMAKTLANRPEFIEAWTLACARRDGVSPPAAARPTVARHAEHAA